MPSLIDIADGWRMTAVQLRATADLLDELPIMKQLLIAKALVYEQCALDFETAYLRGDK